MEQLKNAEQTLKEIGGLVGAVDGDYIGKVRRLVQEFTVESWRVRNLLSLVEYLQDKLKDIEEGYPVDIEAVIRSSQKEIDRIMKR